jgi:ankyrin repeat protein
LCTLEESAAHAFVYHGKKVQLLNEIDNYHRHPHHIDLRYLYHHQHRPHDHLDNHDHHVIAMAHLTMADIKEYPGFYDSSRHVGDVLLGDDAARLIIEASSSGDETTLRNLLSQPQWIQRMLENPHGIYSESRSSQGPNDVRNVSARRMLNLERALMVAVQNGQAAVVSILLDFAAQQEVSAADFITRSLVLKTIYARHAAVFRLLASHDPDVGNFSLSHGVFPLYEAVRLRQTDMVAMLLELGANPLLAAAGGSAKVRGYKPTLMSLAAMSEGPYITRMLLDRGTPIVQTGALHSAAGFGRIDTMLLLMLHDADVNEVLAGWACQTPMHFAALKGQVAAMKLLEQNGALSDLKDEDGKTAAQLLKEYTIA